MSNSELPISKKSPKRIVELATAKAERSSKNQPRQFTWFWYELEQARKVELEQNFISDEEMGCVLYQMDDQNWTVLSSHQLFGFHHGNEFSLEIAEIESYDFGLFKGMNFKQGTLRSNPELTRLKRVSSSMPLA